MARFLLWLTKWLPEPRVIYDREGGTPYLSRWYLVGRRRDSDPDMKGQLLDGGRELPINLFLHLFHRSDDDGALHSHPWKWAVSLVLASGYSEERRVGDAVVRRVVRPFTLNFLKGETYHRVDLIDENAWSLFLVGPHIGTWYFWDRTINARCQWRKFIDAKRRRSSIPWEGVGEEEQLIE